MKKEYNFELSVDQATGTKYIHDKNTGKTAICRGSAIVCWSNYSKVKKFQLKLKK